MSSSDQLVAGSLIRDRYQIMKKLGTGGMGHVYLGIDKQRDDAPRAIKQLVVESTDNVAYQKAIQNFQREAEVLTSIDHPAIPSLFDYFAEQGCYYLVMRYIDGKDLGQLLREAEEGFISERQVTV